MISSITDMALSNLSAGSVANTMVYPPNWATLEQLAASQDPAAWVP